MRLRALLPVCACFGVLFAVAPDAHAQLKEGEFSVQRFLPAPGPRNFLTVEGARTDGKMAFSAGLFVNYASEPFIVTSCRAADCSAPGAPASQQVHVIDSLVTADLLASFTPIPRLQLGLRVPFSSVSGDGIQTSGPTAGDPALQGLKGSGFGDPMLEAKVRISKDPDAPFVLGASAFATAPVGTASAEDKYIGDSSVTTGVRLIGDYTFRRFSFGANVAPVYRKTGTLGATKLGSELRYGLAAAFAISPILRVLGEGFGAAGFEGTSGGNALEADFAAQFTPLDLPLTFTAGAGTRILDGVGTPGLRAFGGILFRHEHSDEDGDGVADDRDRCPTIAEDRDGFQDDDGCPDPDNDDDKILDADDKCPNEPETINNYQDDDGCPDEIPDRDKDGIPDTEDKCPDDGGAEIIHRGDFLGCPDRDHDGVPDKQDKCPDQAEDTDGFQDEDGCPDPDNDGDKIPDTDDQCVDEPEVYNGFQDEDGCPDEAPDRDHDGIPDSKDKCPAAPENYNGIQDDDGCPDAGPNLVEVTTDTINIRDVVNFANDSDKIIGKRSFEVLDGVASALVHHPEIFRVEVGGHTDNVGDPAHNLELSEHRAAAVMAYLISKGVDASRLVSKGYGSTQPIADNKTKLGLAKNRRVEFRILASTKKKGELSPSGAGSAAPAAGSPAPSSSASAPAAPGAPASPAGSAPAAASASPASPPGAAPKP